MEAVHFVTEYPTRSFRQLLCVPMCTPRRFLLFVACFIVGFVVHNATFGVSGLTAPEPTQAAFHILPKTNHTELHISLFRISDDELWESTVGPVVVSDDSPLREPDFRFSGDPQAYEYIHVDASIYVQPFVLKQRSRRNVHVPDGFTHACLFSLGFGECRPFPVPCPPEGGTDLPSRHAHFQKLYTACASEVPNLPWERPVTGTFQRFCGDIELGEQEVNVEHCG